jgi:murein DD-endopeptidase MepM/ murein hydrolase activator NlpD
MSLKKTRFTAMLIDANGLDPGEFQSWLFHPGMLFKSPDKWWGDRGRRDFPHEGIDFCLYRNASGRTCRLDQQTRIPLMHDGVVKAVFSDYLGRAVIVEHENAGDGSDTLVSVYAHTRPGGGITPGLVVKEGDIIGTIADTSRSKAGILPHLHLTLGRPSPALAYERFVWNTMRDPGRVVMLNPMDAIDWPCQVVAQHRAVDNDSR